MDATNGQRTITYAGRTFLAVAVEADPEEDPAAAGEWKARVMEAGQEIPVTGEWWFRPTPEKALNYAERLIKLYVQRQAREVVPNAITEQVVIDGATFTICTYHGRYGFGCTVRDSREYVGFDPESDDGLGRFRTREEAREAADKRLRAAIAANYWVSDWD